MEGFNQIHNKEVIWKQVFARSRKMVIPITRQSLVKNRDFNHSPIIISNGDSNQSPITNQITLHNFLGSNFDYYISNKYSFSIITVVQSACQSILSYFSEKYCLQSTESKTFYWVSYEDGKSSVVLYIIHAFMACTLDASQVGTVAFVMKGFLRCSSDQFLKVKGFMVLLYWCCFKQSQNESLFTY